MEIHFCCVSQPRQQQNVKKKRNGIFIVHLKRDKSENVFLLCVLKHTQ